MAIYMSSEETNSTDHPKTAASAVPIEKILSAHKGEKHLIVLHDYPDPDAIASAYAHKLISAMFDIEADIIYAGRISHAQNISLVRLLDLDLIKFEGELPGEYDAAVFVDNQGANSAEIVDAINEAGIPVLIVVDHHEQQDILDPEVSDIRPVGSTATIYSEYLAQIPIELDPGEKEHVAAATALMHGLISDTGNFINAGKEDFEAAAFLSPIADSETLAQIMSQAHSRKVMDAINKSLDNRILVENFSIAGIGYLRAEERDAIPQAADFLLSEANVHTAIIYGIVVTADHGESLVGSLRTTKITIEPDSFLKEVFGKDDNGRFYGGGKASAGGFEIPIGFLSGDHNQAFLDMKWQVFDQQVKHKIFTKIGVNPEQEEST